MSSKPVVSSAKRSQKGFTLLELMVAMSIFAILAVASWQVFDGISRSKEQAKMQADVLADLQYGYQQLQRDMTQVVSHQVVSEQTGNNLSISNNGDQSAQVKWVNSFILQDKILSFVRYSDPDPRYVQSAILERVVYRFDEGKLVRERYKNLNSGMGYVATSSVPISNEQPLKSVILQGVNIGKFEVLLPQPESIYPSPNDNQDKPQTNSRASEGVENEPKILPTAKLPKGVKISFTTTLGSIDTPITWVYALNGTPPLIESTPSGSP